ncbi:hypothetical protein LZ30DRAFT_307768 [Colletotrichum cereale]|nr:hypothetical protein LZ30DRAFT_307768 [Colletotrichum cereale]
MLTPLFFVSVILHGQLPRSSCNTCGSRNDLPSVLGWSSLLKPSSTPYQFYYGMLGPAAQADQSFTIWIMPKIHVYKRQHAHEFVPFIALCHALYCMFRNTPLLNALKRSSPEAIRRVPPCS